jgi:predicted PurR-regulated permease PerM
VRLPSAYGDTMLRAMLLVGLVFSCLWVLAPFLALLAWGMILAIVIAPLFRRFDRVLRGRRGIALIAFGVVLITAILVPVINLAGAAGEGVEWLRSIDPDSVEVPPVPAGLTELPGGAWLAAKWEWVRSDLSAALASVLPLARDATLKLLQVAMVAGFALLEVIVALVLALLLLHRETKAVAYVQSIAAHIAGDEGAALVELVVRTVRGVFLGIVGTALLQGLLLVLGFALAGVPGAAVLGFIAFVFAVAQLPTLLVWAPVVVWLWYGDATIAAVGIALWGLLVVNTVDNVLKPMIISSGARLPLLLIFIGVIGGLLQFGFLGLFIGPVLLGVGHTLFIKWLEAKSA